MKRANLVYVANVLDINFADHHSDTSWETVIPMRLDATPDRWQEAVLDIARDYEENSSAASGWDSLGVDRIVLTLGVWTVNQATESPFAIYFNDLRFEAASGKGSRIDGRPLPPIPDGDPAIWWRGKYISGKARAGEHRYNLAMTTRFE